MNKGTNLILLWILDVLIFLTAVYIMMNISPGNMLGAIVGAVFIFASLALTVMVLPVTLHTTWNMNLFGDPLDQPKQSEPPVKQGK